MKKSRKRKNSPRLRKRRRDVAEWFIIEKLESDREKWLNYIQSIWPSLNTFELEDLYWGFISDLYHYGLGLLGLVSYEDIARQGSWDKVLESRIYKQLKWATLRYGKKAVREVCVDSLSEASEPLYSKEVASFVEADVTTSDLKKRAVSLSERELVFLSILCRSAKKVVIVREKRGRGDFWDISLDLLIDEMTSEELDRMAPSGSLGKDDQRSEVKKQISRVKHELRKKLKRF